MATRYYVWDHVNDNVTMALDQDGEVVTRYTNLPDLYGACVDEYSGESRFLHFDGTGSTRLITDIGESIVDEMNYSAFGVNESPTAPTDCDLLYKGEVGYITDSSTLQCYARNRTLTPSIGRWLSIDPLNEFTNEPYSYARNNPMSRSDPSGLVSCETTFCTSGGPWGSSEGYLLLDVTVDRDTAWFHAQDVKNKYPGWDEIPSWERAGGCGHPANREIDVVRRFDREFSLICYRDWPISGFGGSGLTENVCSNVTQEFRKDDRGCWIVDWWWHCETVCGTLNRFWIEIFGPSDPRDDPWEIMREGAVINSAVNPRFHISNASIRIKLLIDYVGLSRLPSSTIFDTDNSSNIFCTDPCAECSIDVSMEWVSFFFRRDSSIDWSPPFEAGLDENGEFDEDLFLMAWWVVVGKRDVVNRSPNDCHADLIQRIREL